MCIQAPQKITPALLHFFQLISISIEKLTLSGRSLSRISVAVSSACARIHVRKSDARNSRSLAFPGEQQRVDKISQRTIMIVFIASYVMGANSVHEEVSSAPVSPRANGAQKKTSRSSNELNLNERKRNANLPRNKSPLIDGFFRGVTVR